MNKTMSTSLWMQFYGFFVFFLFFFIFFKFSKNYHDTFNGFGIKLNFRMEFSSQDFFFGFSLLFGALERNVHVFLGFSIFFFLVWNVFCVWCGKKCILWLFWTFVRMCGLEIYVIKWFGFYCITSWKCQWSMTQFDTFA